MLHETGNWPFDFAQGDCHGGRSRTIQVSSFKFRISNFLEPMSELLHEIAIRRAKRALSEKNVPEDVIQRIMTAATYAPSCFNNQPWRFIVIHDQEALEKARTALPGANYWAKKAHIDSRDNQTGSRLSA